MTGALLSFIHKRYWLMYVCMALATVTKGPIGIVFPGAIIFLYLVAMGQLREILRMHVIRGLLLYFLMLRLGITLCIPCMAWNLSIPSWDFTI